MNVVPFPSSRRLRRPGPGIRPPSALGLVRDQPNASNSFDTHEDRLRMRQNVGALVAVLVIVILGAWLIDRLTTYSRTMACLDAGHHNCFQLDIAQPRPW